MLVVGVHRAFIVKANRDDSPNLLAKDDKGGFSAWAGRLGVGIVRFRKLTVLVFLQSTWTLLLWRSPCGFDGDKFWPRGNLAVDVRRHLGLEARRVKTLVALHVRKQIGIETAAAWAGERSELRPCRLVPGSGGRAW